MAPEIVGMGTASVLCGGVGQREFEDGWGSGEQARGEERVSVEEGGGGEGGVISAVVGDCADLVRSDVDGQRAGRLAGEPGVEE